MKKKQIVNSKIEFENEYYVVAKHSNNKMFRVYHKTNDTVITCSKYFIVKSAIIYKNEFGSLFYYNEDVPQYYSEEDQEVIALEIDEVKYKKISNKQLILIKYKDENGNSKDGIIDADGNFKVISVDTLSSILEII